MHQRERDPLIFDIYNTVYCVIYDDKLASQQEGAGLKSPRWGQDMTSVPCDLDSQ